MLPSTMKSGKLFKKMEEETNVVPFSVIEGGLKTGGKEPPSNDWLSTMTPGTVFLASPKQGYDPLCSKFTVVGSADGENDIAVELTQDGSPNFWVIANRFCNKMRLVVILERAFE